MAAYSRQKKLPKLEAVLRPARKVRRYQDPDLMREGILAWAAAAGLKVERHQKPVV